MGIPRTALPITNEEVRQFCLRYFKETFDENLRVIRYEVTSTEDNLRGYLGKHQYLNALVERRTESGISEDKARFFMKSSRQGRTSQKEYLDEFGVFKKETFVYNYVIPRLQAINLGSEYFAPKCYLAKNDVLVFENLSEQGFRVVPRQDGLLDFDHLACILKSLATMHAASIVLEVKTHKLISEIYKIAVEENSYPINPLHVRSLVFKKAVEALGEMIKNIPKYKDSPELCRILISLPNVLGRIFELCKPSTRWKNTFLHGDLWANNLLFKYSKEIIGGQQKPIECRMVDFQLARYAPPTLDVMTILTISTSRSFRDEHLKTLLDTYYTSLEQNLSKHDVNINEMITKFDFEESARHYKLAGLIESCLLSHLVILPRQFFADLLRNSDNFDELLTKHRTEFCLKAFQSDPIYQERMTDMLVELVDTFILAQSPSITKV